jgi:hypothetical protein
MKRTNSQKRAKNNGNVRLAIGQSYILCEGPARNKPATIVGKRKGRFIVADEYHKWEISPEALARIFGPANQRKCGCRPQAEEDALTDFFAEEVETVRPHKRANVDSLFEEDEEVLAFVGREKRTMLGPQRTVTQVHFVKKRKANIDSLFD